MSEKARQSIYTFVLSSKTSKHKTEHKQQGAYLEDQSKKKSKGVITLSQDTEC